MLPCRAACTAITARITCTLSRVRVIAAGLSWASRGAKIKPRDPRQSELFGVVTLRTPFWQTRFYDFNVWTAKKRVEKLRYMHRNPVTRGLAAAPADWRWSSYRFYFLDEPGPVRVNEGWGKISFSAPAA